MIDTSAATTNERPKPWLDRTGMSGKIFLAAAIIGLVSTFLSFVTVAIEMHSPFALGGGFGTGVGPSMPAIKQEESVSVIKAWQGKVCFGAYIATGLLALILYPPKPLNPSALAWAGVTVGLVALVCAFWLLVAALDAGSIKGFPGMGSSISVSIGIGTYLNVVAGAAVVAAGFLKAKEEKLI